MAGTTRYGKNGVPTSPSAPINNAVSTTDGLRLRSSAWVTTTRSHKVIGEIVDFTEDVTTCLSGCCNVVVFSHLTSIGEVLAATDQALEQGLSAAARVIPTGFPALDTYLSGGLREGELCLLGGPQGLGKTTMALQMARNAVVAGNSAVYISFEHDAPTILERLITLEAGELLGLEGLPLRRVREAMENTEQGLGLAQRLADAPGGSDAIATVAGYAERLLLHRALGSRTDLAEIAAVVAEVARRAGHPPLVIVDYLQKVYVDAPAAHEDERAATVVQGLKDLALELGVAVLAVVAADKAGIEAGRRLRVHHLRGTSALAYEADVVLVLNDKFDVVARHHLVYDVTNAERFRDFVVMTIEKNRSGLDKIDLEFRKRFAQSRFEVDGTNVVEQLVDERVFVE